jgi:hypothetical protein
LTAFVLFAMYCSMTDILEQYRFEKYLLEVAIATLKEGGSASRLTDYSFLPPMDAWGFPKYPGKTLILPAHADLIAGLKTFIQANRAYLIEEDSCLGTWIHPTTGAYYLDITTSCETLEEARQKAIERGKVEGRAIIALYNSLREETVYL